MPLLQMLVTLAGFRIEETLKSYVLDAGHSSAFQE